MAIWLLALAAVPVAYGTIVTLAGGFLDGLTHSIDSGSLTAVNGANGHVVLVGADQQMFEDANGLAATVYVGFLDPIETLVTRNAAEDWRGYR
jgi:hypothetical protein